MVEVRRQFKEIAGIMEGKADPDYASCVDLCTKGALHEMVVPSLLAIVVPVVTGLILGAEAVVGLLGGVTVTGFVVAVFMSTPAAPGTTPRSTSRAAPMVARAPTATRPPSSATLWATPSRIPPVPPSTS